MPRNIESLLDYNLQENNLPCFVLTCAIGLNIYPPIETLQKYGLNYGFDNNIESSEFYQKEIEELEIKLAKLNEKLTDEEKLIEEINFVYALKTSDYKDELEAYNEEVSNIERMLIQIRSFSPKDKMQTEFLNEIEKEILRMLSSIQKPNIPESETKEEARKRILLEVEKVKNEIQQIELTIKYLFNQTFFEELSKDWFDKL